MKKALSLFFVAMLVAGVSCMAKKHSCPQDGTCQHQGEQAKKCECPGHGPEGQCNCPGKGMHKMHHGKKACRCGNHGAMAQDATFTLSANVVTTNDSLTATFSKPLAPKPEEKYWITVIKVGAPDTEWGQWKYVDAGADKVELAVPEEPGEYEVRLHGNYPTKNSNVVCRKKLTVK